MVKTKKIGLLTVTALVIGSQIGVGVFLLPSSLANFGSIALVGWLVSALGAILLALIFGKLCTYIPKSRGPHGYVEEAFGKPAAFFTGWSYWIIAWTSNIAVITASVSCLMPILGKTSKITNLLLEIFFFLALTLINLRGTFVAGIIELVLTILKCIPLIIIPVVGLFFFDINNLLPVNPKNLGLLDVIGQSTLLTFWAFIGLESATANASIIDHPEKTVPLAVTYGTICVAILYCLNSVSIMGVIPNNILINNAAPYVEATSRIFGEGWDTAIAIIAFLACIGTLNAWILTSGQIAFGAAKDGLFPKFFAKTNKYNAPSNSILVAFFGTIPLLIMTISDNLVMQVSLIIDAAVTAFLGVYVASMLSFIKLYHKTHPFYTIIAVIGLCFCIWVMCCSNWFNLLISAIIVLSGVPVYFRKK